MGPFDSKAVRCKDVPKKDEGMEQKPTKKSMSWESIRFTVSSNTGCAAELHPQLRNLGSFTGRSVDDDLESMATQATIGLES